MADVRFEFRINGKPICTTGVEGFAVFSASLSYVKRDPKRYDEQKMLAPDDWPTTREEWARESIGIVAHSHCHIENVSTHWFDQELAIGDEVSVRVLGSGEADEPHSQTGK